MGNLTANFGSGKAPAHRHVNGGGWVANTATVEDSAFVGEDARVGGNAWVGGNALVLGCAWVLGNARVGGNARVSGNALVLDDAQVCGDAEVSGNAQALRDARISKPSDLAYESIYKYSVTVVKEYIKIDCKVHTFEEWSNFTDDEIDSMDDEALEWWNKNKEHIFEMHKKVVTR